MTSSDWWIQILKKKIGSLNSGQMGQNQAQNYNQLQSIWDWL